MDPHSQVFAMCQQPRDNGRLWIYSCLVTQASYLLWLLVYQLEVNMLHSSNSLLAGCAGPDS